MTRSYFPGSSSFPNRILLRMVPGYTQGCWEAYVSWPLTFNTPLSSGSSPRMELSSEDWTNVQEKEMNPEPANEGGNVLKLQTPLWNRDTKLTFPAPTGPITANSRLEFRLRETFWSVGASRLCRKQNIQHAHPEMTHLQLLYVCEVSFCGFYFTCSNAAVNMPWYRTIFEVIINDSIAVYYAH